MRDRRETRRRLRRAVIAVVVSLGVVAPAHGATSTTITTRAIADQRAVIRLSDLPDERSVRTEPREFLPMPQQPVVDSPTTPSGSSDPEQTPDDAQDPVVSDGFVAQTDPNTAIPPDVGGAVGPDHVMTTLNTAVHVQTRTGVSLMSKTIEQFWSQSGATGPFDPKIVYDPFADRWLVTAVSNARSGSSALLVGTSATGDPTGTWYLYRTDADSANVSWADYPSIGFTKDWIVVQVNLFSISSSTFTRTHIYAFDRADLSAPGTGRHTLFSDSTIGGVQSPASTYDADVDTAYLLQDFNGNASGSGYLRLFKIAGAVGSEVLTPVGLVRVNAPWSSLGGSGADFAPQKGSSSKIQTNDSRMMNVVYRNGSLWGAHTVFLPAGGATRSAIQWWQIGVDGSVQQRGRIDDSTGSTFTAYPSIAVNLNDDVLIGYSRFSADEYAAAASSFRYGTDAADTMRPSMTLKAGVAPYYKTFSGTKNRWGDYSAAAVDPVNDRDLWTVQQYAAAPSLGSDRWGTWWARIVPTTQPEITLEPASVDFGDTWFGGTSPTTAILVTNTGSAPLHISGLTMDSSVFTLTSQGCVGVAIAVNATCSVEVSFTPSALGAQTSHLQIESDAPGAPRSVALTGIGAEDNTAPASTVSNISRGPVARGALRVNGTATDDLSGTTSVLVHFSSLAHSEDVEADLSCGVDLRSCGWQAEPPLIPGLYTVTVVATDRVGNVEDPGAVRAVTVL